MTFSQSLCPKEKFVYFRFNLEKFVYVKDKLEWLRMFSSVRGTVDVVASRAYILPRSKFRQIKEFTRSHKMWLG